MIASETPTLGLPPPFGKHISEENNSCTDDIFVIIHNSRKMEKMDDMYIQTVPAPAPVIQSGRSRAHLIHNATPPPRVRRVTTNVGSRPNA